MSHFGFLLLAMGNKKSNSYWEAELPPNYDRVGIENFIRAKYDSSELLMASINSLFRQYYSFGL